MMTIETDMKEGTALRSDYYRCKRWLKDADAESKVLLDTLFERFLAKNQDNIEAMLPVREIDLNPIQYDSETMAWGEDYEVGCFYRHPDTEEETYDLETKKEEIGEQIDDLNSEIQELELNEQMTDGEQAQLAEKQAKLKELEDELEGWEKAEGEPEYEEIYWNTMWQPNGEVNEELARRLHFGVLTFLKGPHDGEKFMFLQGCGMDLTPKIVAYNALEHGGVDPAHVGYFTGNIDYTHYVMHSDIFDEVVTKLGIKELAYKRLEEDRDRMRKSNERQAEYHRQQDQARREAEEDRGLPFRVFDVTGHFFGTEEDGTERITARSERAVKKFEEKFMTPGCAIVEVPGAELIASKLFVDTDGTEMTKEEYIQDLKDYGNGGWKPRE